MWLLKRYSILRVTFPESQLWDFLKAFGEAFAVDLRPDSGGMRAVRAVESYGKDERGGALASVEVRLLPEEEEDFRRFVTEFDGWTPKNPRKADPTKCECGATVFLPSCYCDIREETGCNLPFASFVDEGPTLKALQRAAAAPPNTMARNIAITYVHPDGSRQPTRVEIVSLEQGKKNPRLWIITCHLDKDMGGRKEWVIGIEYSPRSRKGKVM